MENGKRMFDTKKQEARIFPRYKWCLEQLFDIKVTSVHLSEIDDFYSVDFHSGMFFNKTENIGLTEIRYTDKEVDVEEESFISLDKKIKSIDTNHENSHRIFLSEQPSSLYIGDLMRAAWTEIRPSERSKRAYYFNKYKTPHLIIPLQRNEPLSNRTAYELRGSLVKEYKNITEAKATLIHMTDSV